MDTELTSVYSRIDNIDITVGEVSDRAVRYDGAQGAAKDIITLEGTTGSTITNLRPGLLSDVSTDAVNGSQLYETNTALAELSDHAVQYDLDGGGNKTNVVTLLGGDPSTPVVIKNVDAGVDPTDAVNVAQLDSGLTTTLIAANTYADSLSYNANSTIIDTAVSISNDYTDFRVGQLSREIDGVRDEARQAAAIGLAASSIRYDDTPGKLSIGMGGGFWRGQARPPSAPATRAKPVGCAPICRPQPPAEIAEAALASASRSTEMSASLLKGAGVALIAVAASHAAIAGQDVFVVKSAEVSIPAGASLGDIRRVVQPFPNWVLLCDENPKSSGGEYRSLVRAALLGRTVTSPTSRQSRRLRSACFPCQNGRGSFPAARAGAVGRGSVAIHAYRRRHARGAG